MVLVQISIQVKVCLCALGTVRLGPSVKPSLVRALRRSVRSFLIRPNVLSGNAFFFVIVTSGNQRENRLFLH